MNAHAAGMSNPTPENTSSAAPADVVPLPPVPFLTISDGTCIADLVRMVTGPLEPALPPRQLAHNLPILACFIGAGPPRRAVSALPIEPSRLVLFTVGSEAHLVSMSALSRVEKQEPNFGKAHLGRLDFSSRTPFKTVFDQMARVPITVLSLQQPESGGCIFFLRTPFTISRFFVELGPDGDGAGTGKPSNN